MFSLSTRNISREKDSHSRHIFSLFAVLFSLLSPEEISERLSVAVMPSSHHCSNKSEQGATRITRWEIPLQPRARHRLLPAGKGRQGFCALLQRGFPAGLNYKQHCARGLQWKKERQVGKVWVHLLMQTQQYILVLLRETFCWPTN